MPQEGFTYVSFKQEVPQRGCLKMSMQLMVFVYTVCVCPMASGCGLPLTCIYIYATLRLHVSEHHCQSCQWSTGQNPPKESKLLQAKPTLQAPCLTNASGKAPAVYYCIAQSCNKPSEIICKHPKL